MKRNALLFLCVAVATSFAAVCPIRGHATGAEAASSGPDFSKMLEDPSEELAARNLVGDYRVSIAEARRQLAQQAVLTDVAARLAGSDEHWGGSYFDRADGGRLVVQSTDPVSLQTPLSAESAEIQQLVTVKKVDDTQADLMRSAEELDTRLRLSGATFSSSSADIESNQVQIVVPTSSDLASVGIQATENRARIADVISESKRDVLVVERGGISQPKACLSGFNLLCDPPLRGGVEMQLGNSSGSGCTLGFVVRSTLFTSYDYALTAGHCNTANDTWYTAFSTYGSNPTGHDIGLRHNSLYSQGFHDAMIVDVANSSGWSLPTQTKVLVLSSGGTYPTVYDRRNRRSSASKRRF